MMPNRQDERASRAGVVHAANDLFTQTDALVRRARGRLRAVRIRLPPGIPAAAVCAELLARFEAAGITAVEIRVIPGERHPVVDSIELATE